MKQKKKQADDVGAFLGLWRETESNGKVNGLRAYHKASSCIVRACCAIICLTSSITGGRGRSLHCQRRIIATPSCGVFSCAIVQYHGVIASILRMGAPCGGLICPPFPLTRYFLHPHGAVRLVGGVDGFDQLVKGSTAMFNHIVERLRAPIPLKQASNRKASSCAVCVRRAIICSTRSTTGAGLRNLNTKADNRHTEINGGFLLSEFRRTYHLRARLTGALRAQRFLCGVISQTCKTVPTRLRNGRTASQPTQRIQTMPSAITPQSSNLFPLVFSSVEA